VLEFAKPKTDGGRMTPLQNYLHHRQVFEAARAAPSVQLLARDTFVSETSVKLDQTIAEMKELSRDLQLIKGDIAELREDSARGYRFSEFMEREHKARALKLDELARRFDYLKTRFDAADGNSDGDYQAFRSFEAVSRRLTELGSLEREFRDIEWKLKLSVGLFAGSLLVWVLIVVTA
jgi:hypothetical protein